MIDLNLYSSSHSITNEAATYFLKTYGKLLHWQNNENIMDVGVADGDVTLNCLLPTIPKSFKKLVGIEIISEMVELSKTKTKNPEIDFVLMDITTPSLPPEFHENFHHIFSFYVLHWIRDQRAAFRNMYKMLKPGGEIFVTCFVHIPIYDAQEALAKTKKWAPFTSNYKEYIPVYYYADNPTQLLKKYIEDEGLVCQLCHVEKNFVYKFKDMKEFKDLYRSVNPFCQTVPEDKRAAYTEDFFSILKSLDSVKFYYDSKGEEIAVDTITTPMIAIASKPL